jgi:phosphate transport system substrate-binding protein
LVLGKQPLAPDAKRFESSEDLSDAVAADVHGIGFISLHYVRSAKAVMVRQSAGSPPVLPSTVSIGTEDYPLSRRLYLYMPSDCPVVARDFVDFALSDEGQSVIESVGFVSLRPTCEPAPPTCATCSAPYRDVVRGACRMSIDFRFDQGQLDTRALRDLQRITAFMRQPANASKSLVLVGFGPSTGSRTDDLATSQKSADMVGEQLRARGLRIAAAHGMGSDGDVADSATHEAHEHNRRVEVWLR